MKQQFTTLVALPSLPEKITLVVIAVVVAISTSLSFSVPAKADQFDERIRQVQQEIDQYKSKAKQLNDQANTLQGVVDGFNNQISIIQGQINLSQAKHDQLVAEITLNEKKIDTNQTVLGETIAALYVDEKISPLEMLASSKNISEYVDKQEYRSSVRDGLSEAITTIKNTKKELENQKVDVVRVLADQQNAQRELDSKRAEQQAILNQAKGDEAAYQDLAQKSEAQKVELMRQQQATIQRRTGTVDVLPGDPNKGGYPWGEGWYGCYVGGDGLSRGGEYGNGQDPLGYGCRQCVSYTGWKVLQRTGYEAKYWGNANMWPGSARSAGFPTGSTPRANSVGVISEGRYGHVVWVEAVNGDGTIDISQYNYENAGGSGWGHYSKMRVSAGTYDTYIYF